MYRVNKNNIFNVPFGYKEKISIYNKDNIKNLSKFLKTTKIYNKDYKEIIKLANKDDLIFADPPYDKINKNTFISYDKNEFGEIQQKELSEELKNAHKRGAKFITTNHNTDLINNLYKEFNKIIVPVNRNINSDGEKRSNLIEEVIIFNFKISKDSIKDIKFENFIQKMKPTNRKLDKLVDWDKVVKNMKKYEFKLNNLNYLISKNEEDLYNKIKILIKENNESFSALPILLAFRNDDNKSYNFLDESNKEFEFIKNGEDKFELKNINKFINQTNLKKIFLDRNITNLKDYVTGIEVGLDSNARKNRFGNIYENMIENLLKKYNIEYQKQFILKSNNKKNKDKKFDFKINLNNKIYLIEVNFYNSNGSKLNAISGEYIELNEQIKNLNNNYEFIWITDGKGWVGAKNALYNAYLKIENVFNYNEFENFLSKKQNELLKNN